MIDDPTTHPLNNKLQESVPSEWVSKFKNNQSDEPARGGRGH